MVSMMRRQSALLLLCLTLAVSALWAGEPPDEPMLRLETGRHTAAIWQIASDVRGRWLATASDDKTLRLWDSTNGKLLYTWRLPIGSGHEGKLYAVAMDPGGAWLAVGGWYSDNSVYILDRTSGRLRRRLDGIGGLTHHLCTSADERWLAATLWGNNGIRIFDAKDNFRQIFSDNNYGDSSYGCAFSPDSQRIVTSSLDGLLRLYRFTGEGFKPITQTSLAGGKQPSSVAFHPDGRHIAVGFKDTTAVQVVDGENLGLRYTVDTVGINNGNLESVAWSDDGVRLFAGGRHGGSDGIVRPVLSWSNSGRGSRRVWPAANNSVMSLKSLPNGKLAVGAADPALLLFDRQGNKLFDLRPRIADLRNQYKHFRISSDGQQLAFGLKALGKEPVWFDLKNRRLRQGKVSATAQIQTRLTDLGYSLGAIDGKSGPKTRAAAAAYRLDNGISGKGSDRRLQQSLGITQLSSPRIHAPA